jgi:hypothetical protein
MGQATKDKIGKTSKESYSLHDGGDSAVLKAGYIFKRNKTGDVPHSQILLPPYVTLSISIYNI